ncbi:hypothetical protein BDV93DRAFT_552726 [Ceratobasidium sp. AG-I]|nr:hypothetical protein BDV93DRAFT_552726 [Ceratobasidium sp. AG-I]
MRAFAFLSTLLLAPGIVSAYPATPHRRTGDTCSNINLSIKVLILTVNVKVCACLNGIDALIAGNANLGLAVNVLGVASVKAQVADAINHGNNKSVCTYPDYAVASCTTTNPCDYQCPPGRVKVNDQCVCPPNQIECNGKCVVARSCPSQAPCSGRYCKRDQMRIEASAEYCETDRPGTEVCAVPGTMGGWECIKTGEDLESCGGCAYPFFEGQKQGVDCSSLDGVDVVSCIRGECHVRKCQAGWTVSEGARSCQKGL